MATDRSVTTELELRKQRNWDSTLNEAEENLNGFAAAAARMGGQASGAAKGTASLAGTVGMLGAAAAGLGLVTAARELAQFGAASIKTAAGIESLAVSYRVMTGDAALATRTLSQLYAFAASTPFEIEDVTKAGRSLLAYGFQAEELTTVLRQVGDVAAGTGSNISDLASIFGKMRTSGRVMTEDLNQLGDRGIPVISELAAHFGVAEASIRDMASNGEISFSDLQEVFAAMSAEGGRFANMMGEAADTTEGKFSNLEDAVYQLEGAFGSFLIEVTGLNGWLDQAASLVGMLTNKIREMSGNVDHLSGEYEALVDEISRYDELEKALETYERLSGELNLSEEQTRELQDAISTLEGQYPGYISQTNAAGQAVSFYSEQIRTAIALHRELAAQQAGESLETLTDSFEENAEAARLAKKEQELFAQYLNGTAEQAELARRALAQRGEFFAPGQDVETRRAEAAERMQEAGRQHAKFAADQRKAALQLADALNKVSDLSKSTAEVIVDAASRGIQVTTEQVAAARNAATAAKLLNQAVTTETEPPEPPELDGPKLPKELGLAGETFRLGEALRKDWEAALADMRANAGQELQDAMAGTGDVEIFTPGTTGHAREQIRLLGEEMERTVDPERYQELKLEVANYEEFIAQMDGVKAKTEEVVESWATLNESLSQLFIDATADLVGQAAETFATLADLKAEGVEDPWGDMFTQWLGDFLSHLGDLAIKAGAKALAFNILLGLAMGGGPVGIGAAFGLIALGAALKGAGAYVGGSASTGGGAATTTTTPGRAGSATGGWGDAGWEVVDPGYNLRTYQGAAGYNATNSQSGQTIFLEPMPFVLHGDELRALLNVNENRRNRRGAR